MPIKCVTLDLDNTLWEVDSVILAAEQTFYLWLSDICPEITARYSIDELARHRHEYYTGLSHMRHNFTYLRRRWLAHLGEEAGLGDGLVEPGFRTFWKARNDVKLFEGALKALESLNASYRVGAITNGNADVHHIGIGRWFNFVVTAAQAGTMKPEPGIFEAALTMAAVSPQEVVHVGDDPITDIKGAAEVGMRTIWMNPDAAQWPGGPPPDAEIRCLAELRSLLQQWD